MLLFGSCHSSHSHPHSILARTSRSVSLRLAAWYSSVRTIVQWEADPCPFWVPRPVPPTYHCALQRMWESSSPSSSSSSSLVFHPLPARRPPLSHFRPTVQSRGWWKRQASSPGWPGGAWQIGVALMSQGSQASRKRWGNGHHQPASLQSRPVSRADTYFASSLGQLRPARAAICYESPVKRSGARLRLDD